MPFKIAFGNGICVGHKVPPLRGSPYDIFWKGVEDIMRGKIIDFPAKRERDAGRREGREEGRVEGKIMAYVELYKSGVINESKLYELIDEPADRVREIIANYSSGESEKIS